jgi:hypothetical protein
MLLSRNCLRFAVRSQRSSFCPQNTVQSFGDKRLFAIVPFKLADIGEGIAEVELLKWYVKV